MKIYFLLFIALITLSSCSSDSDSPKNDEPVAKSAMDPNASYQEILSL